MAKRQYTEEFKATVLANLEANKGNIQATAAAFSIPWSTVKDWSKGEGVNPAVTEKREEKKEELSAVFETVLREALEVFNDKLSGAKAVELATGIGILTDKMLLLRGQATSITATEQEEARDKKLQQIKEAVKLRMVG